MAGIKIPISIDNANFTAAANEAKQAVKSVSGEVRGLEKDTNSATDSMKEMIKQAAAFGGISLGLAGAKEFVSQIVDVRKEMQGYQTSLNVLLGDQAKANAMFSELKDFAVTTPLMFKDLAAGAQTMLGFNIEAEKVVPTLKAIGDISMGDAGKFQSLTLAFSQMSATGKLMGQDLLQMINAGFNPLTEISKKTGKSIGELKDEMSAGSISAEMVADAFMAATQEGGKFYGMLEKQGQGLAGKLNTLQGAIDDMFNNLGQQSEGVINAAVEGATDLVKNYEKVGKAVMDLTVAYGSYKAALMTISAIQNVKNNTSVADMQREIEAYRAKNAVQVDATAETIKEAAAKANLDAATTANVEALYAEIKAEDELYASRLKAQVASGSITASQEQELLAMKASSTQKVLMTAIDKESASQALSTATSRYNAAKKVAKGLDEEFEMYEKLMNENENLGKSELANFYAEKLQVNMTQQKAASTELAAAAKAKDTAQENFNTIAKNANTAATERQNIAQLASVKSMGLMTAAGVQLRNIIASITAAIDANPLMILAAAVAAVGYAVYKGLDVMGAFNEKLMTAQDIQDKLAAGTENLTKAQEEQRKETERLLGVLRDSSSTDAEKILAYEELKKKCAVLTEQYSIEELAVMDLTDAYKKLKEAQEKQSTGQLIMDTQRMERVLSDLEKVRSKQARSSSAETQQYIKDNGLVGQSTKDIIKALKERISANRELISVREKANNEAKGDVQNKAYWEGLKKTAQAELDGLDLKTAGKDKVNALKAQIKKYEEEIKKYNVSDSSKSENSAAKKAQEDQQKLNDIRQQMAKETARAAEDQENNTTQARINAMEEGSEKVLAQLDLNYKKELQEINREKEDLLAAREEAARKQWEAENAKAIREGKISWDTSEYKKQFNESNKLTPEDIKYFNEREKAATKAFEKGVADRHVIDEQSRIDYLKAYGTLEEKKAAVTEEYQEKIRQAQAEGDEWLAKNLQEQMKQAINDIDMEAFKLDINWEAVFGDMSKYTKKQLKTIKTQLEQYKLSDNYVKGTEENKKVIDEAINNVQNNIVSASGIFGGLGYALQELAKSQTELADAEKDLEKATTSAEKQAAKNRKNAAQKKVDNAEANLKSASDSTANYLSNISRTITSLGTASEMTLSDLGSLASSIAGAFGEAGQKAGGWIAAIFDICEMVAKDGLVGLIENVGKLVGQVIGGIFGFDIDESTHEYEKQKKIHDNYIDVLNGVISEQEKILERQGALEAAQTSEDAKKNYDTIKDMRRQDMRNYLNAGASTGFLGIGSSSSNGYNLKDNLFSKSLKDIFGERLGIEVDTEYSRIVKFFNSIGVSIDELGGRMEGLADLTIDQYKALQKNDQIWGLLPEDVQKYINEIMDADQAIADLTQHTIESITNVSFDSLHDSFVDSLMDMDKSAEEFAADFSKYMMKASMESFVKDKLDKDLKAWQEDWLNRMNDSEELSKDDIDALRKEYNRIIAEGEAKRDELAKVTGYGTAQEEALDGFDNMKQSFLDMITDMEATSEDFAENFSKLMYDAMVNAQIKDAYDDKIKEWYKEFQSASENGDLTPENVATLRKSYMDIMEAMRKEANGLAELAGAINDKKDPLIEYDAIRSQFSSLILDMSNEATAFTDSLKQQMYEALIQKELEDGLLGSKLKDWYKDFAVFMDEKNGDDEEMYNDLMSRYSAITKESQEYADSISKMLDIPVKKLEYITFEQVKSGFSSLITGMTMSAEDFTENFKKMLFQAVVTSHIENAFSAQLDELSKQMQKFIEDGGDVESEEYGKLLNGYVAIGEQAAKYAQGVADKMGYTVNKVQEVVEEAETEDKKFDFDYIKDGFSSLLSDMSADAEAFGKKFNEVMFEALLDKQITSKFEGRLQNWYNDFDRFLESDGDVNSDAYRDLLNRYQSLGAEAANAAQALADAIGISTEDMLDKLTTTSYDSVRSQFENLLMDMSSDSQTFAEDFTEMLQKALINAQLTDLLDDELKTWYKQFGEVMNDGKLTDTEIADLRASYNNIVQDALERRDAIADITGYGLQKATAQGGGSSSFQGMSKDTGNEINGRFTALQIAGESMAASMIEYITQMRSLVAVSIEQNQAVQEIRNMMVYTNSYLDDILKYAKLCHSTLSQKLGTISSNTKNF